MNGGTDIRELPIPDGVFKHLVNVASFFDRVLLNVASCRQGPFWRVLRRYGI